MRPLTADQIRGNWSTVLLPINADQSIDWNRLDEELDRLVEFCPDGVYSNGTAGEFFAQTEEEFDRIQEMVASKFEAAEIPFQIGASHPAPHISLSRIRRAAALQPGAIQVILPDWFPVVEEEAISALTEFATAAGDIPLVLYNPPHAKRVLSPSSWKRIRAAVPNIVGVKVAGGSDPEWYGAILDALDGAALFVAGHFLATGIRLGAHGSYSNVACLHPKGAQRWYECMLRDLDRALGIEGRIQGFLQEHIHPLIHEERYANPAIDKLLAAIGGWTNVGTRMRWPYRWVPEERVAALRDEARKKVPELFEDS